MTNLGNPALLLAAWYTWEEEFDIYFTCCLKSLSHQYFTNYEIKCRENNFILQQKLLTPQLTAQLLQNLRIERINRDGWIFTSLFFESAFSQSVLEKLHHKVLWKSQLYFPIFSTLILYLLLESSRPLVPANPFDPSGSCA